MSMQGLVRVISICIMSLSMQVLALEQGFSQLYLRGTFNDWQTTPMSLIADHTWRSQVTFSGAENDRFKFDRHGDWSNNYGDNNGDGVADFSGNDIAVPSAGDYLVTFNDQTLQYSLVKAVEDTHQFSQLYLRGTHNGWDAYAMSKSDGSLWLAEIYFDGEADARFKFDRFADWRENYGDSDSNGVAEQGGGDIFVSQGAGDYRVQFDDRSFVYTVTKLGASNLPPVAVAGNDLQVEVGSVVNFDASGSYDPDGAISTYAWSNGLNGVTASKTYASPGEYHVTLTVTDNEGAQATDSLTVTVSETHGYQANFQQLYLRGTSNGWDLTAMQLTANNTWAVEAEFTDAADQRFKFDHFGDWSQNFGDNNADGWAEQSGGDIYLTQGAGGYLIEFNDETFAYRVTQISAPNKLPVANAGQDIWAAPGEPVQFDASLSDDPDGEIVSYLWSNGMTGVAPLHTFVAEGIYEITLTVVDDQGAEDTDTVVVTIADQPAAPAACDADIQFLGDADKDGLPDCAEMPGIVYLDEYYYDLGARAGTRDLFVEIDWMETTDLGVIPQKEALEMVRDAFADSGIAIHFDTGALYHTEAGISPGDFDLGGGNALPFTKTIQLHYSSDPEIAGLYNLKLDHMALQRRLNGPWYYMVFGSSRKASGAAGSSGVAYVNGKESIVSLGKWGLNRNTDRNTNLLINYQAGTVMHEFGHNLGLLHGGHDNVNYKSNYLSVMNYLHQLDGLPTIGVEEGDRVLRRLHGSLCVPAISNAPTDDYRYFKIDYSHGISLDLDETGARPMVEKDGFGHPGSVSIDYNCDGDDLDFVYDLDVNRDGNYDVLEDHDDWSNINFYFYRGEGAGMRSLSVPQVSIEPAPSPEFFEQLQQLMD
ncbi:PKD domain-containing protein [Corallincola platygyrae]|uniref:PKD domain-containing protein n=1 Tax=Corallincola platygyrae TaxID=1193278 RepID=A0ABW4XJ12_9GAMM